MAEKQPYQALGTSDQWTAASESSTILGLREQIKGEASSTYKRLSKLHCADKTPANAGLLFPHGAAGVPQLAYDIAIMTSSTDKHNARSGEPGYQAVLICIGAISQGMRKGGAAARGQSRPNVISALESLLHVTAVALQKFQGNVLKEATAPSEIAGGLIDESLVLGKSWKSLLGGKK